jgi:hypothetical protein
MVQKTQYTLLALYIAAAGCSSDSVSPDVDAHSLDTPKVEELAVEISPPDLVHEVRQKSEVEADVAGEMIQTPQPDTFSDARDSETSAPEVYFDWAEAVDTCQPEESVCDGADDDCDGDVDEGLLSPCGNCDPDCRQIAIGAGGDEPFAPNPDNSDGCDVNEESYLIMSGGSSPEESTYWHRVFVPEGQPVVWVMAIADLDTQGTTECFIVLRLRAGEDPAALNDEAWETAFWPLTDIGPVHGLELFGFPPSSILDFEVKLVAGSSGCVPFLRSMTLQYRAP